MEHIHQITQNLEKIRPPFNVTTGAIAAGMAALDDEEHLKKVVNHNSKTKQWFIDGLNNLGFEAYQTQANFVFVIIPETKNQNANKINEFLLSEGIALRYLSTYGLNNALRITLGTKEDLSKTLELLEKFKNNNK